MTHNAEIDALAAILDEHAYGNFTHLFHEKPGGVIPPVMCRCGWRGLGGHHTRHLAEVIAAGWHVTPPAATKEDA